jgi:hypothetical protein
LGYGHGVDFVVESAETGSRVGFTVPLQQS